VKGTRCRNNTGLWLLLSHRTNAKCGHRQQPLAPSSLFHLSPSFFSPPLFLCRLSFSPCCVFDRSVLCGVLCGSKSRICLSLCLLCQPSRVIDRSSRSSHSSSQLGTDDRCCKGFDFLLLSFSAFSRSFNHISFPCSSVCSPPPLCRR